MLYPSIFHRSRALRWRGKGIDSHRDPPFAYTLVGYKMAYRNGARDHHRDGDHCRSMRSCLLCTHWFQAKGVGDDRLFH